MLSMKRKVKHEMNGCEGLAELCDRRRKPQTLAYIVLAGFAIASIISLFLLLCPIEPRYTHVCQVNTWGEHGQWLKMDVFPCSAKMVYTPEAIAKQVSWYDSFWPLVFK